MRSLQLLTALCLTTIVNSGCGSIEIADVGPMVTLPYTGDCYQVTVLTHKKTRYPKPQCDDFKKRGVVLTSEDWKKQRVSIQKNCQLKQCKQLVGAFDELFLAIDSALQKIPTK